MKHLDTLRGQKRKRDVQVTNKLYGNNKNHLRGKIFATFAPMLQMCTYILIISSILVLKKSGLLTVRDLQITGLRSHWYEILSVIRISHHTSNRWGDLSHDWHVLICSSQKSCGAAQ